MQPDSGGPRMLPWKHGRPQTISALWGLCNCFYPFNAGAVAMSRSESFRQRRHKEKRARSRVTSNFPMVLGIALIQSLRTGQILPGNRIRSSVDPGLSGSGIPQRNSIASQMTAMGWHVAASCTGGPQTSSGASFTSKCRPGRGLGNASRPVRVPGSPDVDGKCAWLRRTRPTTKR